MVDLQKASLTTNGQQVTLTMPISKVDVEKRIVSGFATLDNVDRQGDRVTSEASQKAFENFRGNVRLMHQPIPAGKVVNFRTETFFDTETNKQYSGVYVDAYISKGADSIWEMVLDGTLTGFSIGGNVKDSEPVLDAESQKTVRIIKDYDLVELSLVDSPANQLANIFSIQKNDDGSFADGIFNKSNIQNVFWCETDSLAYTSTDETHKCANCNCELPSVGWVDEIGDAEVAKAVFAMVKAAANTVTNEDTENKYPEQNKFKSELTKAWSVVTDHPDCQGYAVVGDSGNLHGCFKTEAEARAAVAAHNSDNNDGHDGNGHDGNDDMQMSKKKDENERKDKNKNEMHKRAFNVGDFVQWNSSGGTARGKITRIVTSGKIVVPNSSATITATPENPAVAITVYQESNGSWKPTDIRVGHKMNTLRAWSTKVKKVFGIPTKVLLSNEVVNKAIETDTQSVANQNNEGGVEVAENTEATTDVVEEVVVDEVIEEVEAVEAEESVEAVAKSDVVEEDSEEEAIETVEEAAPEEEAAEADASTENGEASDLEKALNEVKTFVEEIVAKSTVTNVESVTAVAGTVADVTKALGDKITEVENGYAEVNKALAGIAEVLSTLSGRVESVEADTAVKKSGELGESSDKTITKTQSTWGGRFLGTAELI